jgi:hypothetical protein
LDLDSHFRGDVGLVYTVMSEKRPADDFDYYVPWKEAVRRNNFLAKQLEEDHARFKASTQVMARHYAEYMAMADRELTALRVQLEEAERKLKKYRAAEAAEAASIMQEALDVIECDDIPWSFTTGEWYPAEEEKKCPPEADECFPAADECLPAAGGANN